MNEKIPLFSGEPPPGLLGPVGGFLSATAVSTFVASVLYDWGFLAALGLGFEDVPTTLADHTRSALLWLPAMTLVAFVYLAVELLTQRLDNGKQAGDYPPPRGCVMSFYVNGPRWVLWALGPLAFILFGEMALGLFVGVLSAAWLAFAYWIVTHPVIGSRLSWLMRRAFYYLPATALVIFGIGYQTGALRIVGARDVATMHGEAAETSRVLRQFETGILVRDADSTAFVRWDAVRSITVPARQDIWGGFYCAWNECPAPRQAAPPSA